MIAHTESIVRISLPKYTVRVWRREERGYKYQSRGFSDIHIMAYRHQEDSLHELAERIAELPDIVSVEVLDWDRNGIVIYTDGN